MKSQCQWTIRRVSIVIDGDMMDAMTTSASPTALALPELTMLNAMAGGAIEDSLARQRELGVRVLDLKNQVFDRSIEDLDPSAAERLAALVAEHGMRIQTLSTCIGLAAVELGEAAWRERFDPALARVEALVPILRPAQVRLLSPQSEHRDELTDAVSYLRAAQPWVLEWFAEAADRLVAAGTAPVLENEVGGNCIARPQEALDLLAAIGRPRLRLIWDVVNLWQMGTYPSVAVYRQLSPVIAMLHIKGGRADRPGGVLRWRSSLAAASWPLREVLAAALRDGASPVLCLNPPHGAPHDDHPFDTESDLRHLRSLCEEICA